MPETGLNETNRITRRKPGVFSFLQGPRSLRSKLALWNALVLLLTLALLSSIVYQMVTYRLVADLDARLRTQEVRLETGTRQWKFSGSPSDFTFLKQLLQGESITEFTGPALASGYPFLGLYPVPQVPGKTSSLIFF